MTLDMIVLRYIASLTGCTAVIITISLLRIKDWKFVHFAGIYSLEIYLIHGLFLNLFKWYNTVDLMSFEGIMVVSVNYVITLTLSYFIIKVAQTNSLLNRLLFYKKISFNIK